MDVIVPPNSSLAFVSSDGDLTNEAIDRWAPPGSSGWLFGSTPRHEASSWVFRRIPAPIYSFPDGFTATWRTVCAFLFRPQTCRFHRARENPLPKASGRQADSAG